MCLTCTSSFTLPLSASLTLTAPVAAGTRGLAIIGDPPDDELHGMWLHAAPSASAPESTAIRPPSRSRLRTQPIDLIEDMFFLPSLSVLPQRFGLFLSPPGLLAALSEMEPELPAALDSPPLLLALGLLVLLP